jgi:hypothetical protein
MSLTENSEQRREKTDQAAEPREASTGTGDGTGEKTRDIDGDDRQTELAEHEGERLDGLIDSFASGIDVLAQEAPGQVPHGAVPQVEPSWFHEEFMSAAEPDWVLLKLQYADRLRQAGETAESWTPEGTQVVTTSTIADERLAELSVTEEAQVVNGFQPAAHIGGDVAVYREWEKSRRIRGIDHMMRNALWLKEVVSDQTVVLPVLKGQTQTERELVYRAVEEFDHNCVVQYATQYFTGGKGPQFGPIQEQLETVAEETQDRWGSTEPQPTVEPSSSDSPEQLMPSPDGGSIPDGKDQGQTERPGVREHSLEVFVVGCTSPKLAQVDADLAGVAGLNGWLKHVERDTATQERLQTAYAQLRKSWETIRTGEE